MKSEVKVGIFVFSAIVMLFLMSTQINRFSVGQKSGYPIEALLGNASGLEMYAKVKVNGVESGHVSRVYLYENQAYATLFLQEGVKIPVDSKVLLTQESMLGSKYIELIPGASLEVVERNGVLKNQKIMSSFDQTSDSINEAAIEFKEFIKEAREVLNEESRQDLTQTFANLRRVTETIEAMLAENRSELKKAIEGVRLMASSLEGAGREFGTTSSKFGTTADTINAKLPHIVDRVDSVVTGADEVIQENKQPLNDALKSVDQFFSNGNRVVNKLDDYLSIVDRSEIEVGMHMEHLARDSYSKGYASLYYKPNPTRYYMFDIVSTDDYSKEINGQWVEPKRTDKAKYYFSAQLGKRYDDLLLRGGIIESTAGVGIDYFFLNDQLRTSLEAFDFDGKHDLRGENPHLKASVRYTILRHVDTYFGVDNFLNKDSVNGFVGIGVRFVDDDMKKLLGTMGGASSLAR